jgi:hypothetical protein
MYCYQDSNGIDDVVNMSSSIILAWLQSSYDKITFLINETSIQAFNKTMAPHFVQDIYRALYWIHMWSFLLPVEQQEHIDSSCNRLMAVVQTIFNQGG